MTTPSSVDWQALKEKLSAIEHERWSDWQKWCHKVIRENVRRTDELEAVLARWDRQIDVPYELLTDSEKASDMEQVDRYWPLVEAHINQAVVEARIDELEKFMLDANVYGHRNGNWELEMSERIKQLKTQKDTIDE